MAMLETPELMYAGHDRGRDVQAAKYVNAFWFPQQSQAMYFNAVEPGVCRCEGTKIVGTLCSLLAA